MKVAELTDEELRQLILGTIEEALALHDFDEGLKLRPDFVAMSELALRIQRRRVRRPV